jgi:hypothetical protein
VLSDVASQVRDYLAAMYAGDAGKWARLQRLQSLAYFVLQLFGVRDYGNAILLNKLQLSYLESINHPCLAAVRDDLSLLVEEPCEQSLAALAQRMLRETDKSSIETLSATYKLTFANRALTHEALAQLGVVVQDRTHLVVSSQRKDEVAKMKSFLHALSADLRNDELKCFIAAHPGARRADNSGSSSASGSNRDDDDDAPPVLGPADPTFVSRARINKDAQVQDSEPTVWLTEDAAAEVNVVEQLMAIANKFSPGGAPHQRYWNDLFPSMTLFR